MINISLSFIEQRPSLPGTTPAKWVPPLYWTWYQSKLNKSWMPWRKYLLITLTKKSPIFKLFTSPISLFCFPSYFCLLFPFVPSPTRGSQHLCYLRLGAAAGHNHQPSGSRGASQCRHGGWSPCHEGRLACVTRRHEPTRDIFWLVMNPLPTRDIFWLVMNPLEASFDWSWTH